jgi:hypothetical protein
MAGVCLGNKVGRIRVEVLTIHVSGSTGNNREDFRISVFRLIFQLATTLIELESVIATPHSLVLFVWDLEKPKFSSCNVIKTGRFEKEDEMGGLVENLMLVHPFLTTSTNYTSNNLPRLKNQRLPVPSKLLMMGGVSPETCRTSYKYGIIKF